MIRKAAYYGTTGIALIAMNWDYLFSHLAFSYDTIAFLYSVHNDLYHISASFVGSLDKFEALARAPFFCKNNGLLACFQTKYKDLLKKH